MKTYINKNRLLNIYFVFFVLCLLYKFANFSFNNDGSNFWDVSEWLINYQGGFVRRGLKGEFVYFMYRQFSIDPYFVMTFVSGITFVVLSCIFVKKFIRKGYSIFVLPFVFFLGNSIINETWLKIENLLLVIFILIIYLVINKPRFYLIWVNLLSIFGLLNHESFIFYSFPIIFLLISHNISSSPKGYKSYFYSFCYLIPTILAFLSVSYFKGSEVIASSIWNSWSDVNLSHINTRLVTEKPPFAIAALEFSLKEGLYWYSGNFLRIFNYGLYGPMMLIISVIVVYFILTNINKLDNPILGYKPKNLENKSVVSSILLFQFIAVFPLFILGCDYSRWISFWVITSFSLLLFVPDKTLMKVLPKIVINLSEQCNLFLYRLFGDSKSLIIILMLSFGIGIYGWSLIDFTKASSLYIVLSTISSFFEFILKAFHIACYQELELPLI